MEFYDIVEKAAAEQGIPISRLGIILGHSSAYITSGRSRGSVPKVNSAAKILSACGYKICVFPKGQVPESAIEIDAAGGK